MIKNYSNKFLSVFFAGISKSPNVEILTTSMTKSNRKLLKKNANFLPKSLYDYYRSCDYIFFKWKPKKVMSKGAGSVELIDLKVFLMGKEDYHPDEYVLYGFENVEWTFYNKNGREKFSNLNGQFRVIDRFCAEGAIGFVEKDGEIDDILHYYGMEYELYSLNINFEGYFKLLCASYGYLYWQRVITYLEYGLGKVEHDNFKENMPKLFPTFSYDKFIELYELLKIVD